MKCRSLRVVPTWIYAAAILCALVPLLSPLPVEGASFDCGKSRTFIEKAICGNKQLSGMDDRLAEEYGKALAVAFAPDELKEEQRDWLAKVRNSCQDSACLKRVYAQRIELLSTYGERQRTSREKEVCEFKGLALPESYAIFAAGGYTGRKIDFQIDQSGHQATQMDVTVNYSPKPVVLMLGAYEPTIWNIRWSPATRIVAVLVSGYHRQAVAGLDPAVPVLNSSYDNKGPCGYFYVGENDLGKLNPMARRFFDRQVDSVYLSKNGEILVGDPVPAGIKLITSEANPPESFHDTTAPLAGPAGLEDAVRKGLLRKATTADVDAWVAAAIANEPDRDVPPVAGQVRPRPVRPHTYNAYVVLKQFTFPAGLYGGNSATFFVPKGVPRPKGNPGHSDVYDFNRFRIDPAPGKGGGQTVSAGATPSLPEEAFFMRSNKAHRSGKYYFEVTVDHGNIRQDLEADIQAGVKGGGKFLASMYKIQPRNLVIHTGENSSITIVGGNLGDVHLPRLIIGVAVDLDARRFYRHRNGDWEGKQPDRKNGTTLPEGDEFAAVVKSSVPIAPLIDAKILAVNFGAQPFAYTLPAEYVAFDNDARRADPASPSAAFSVIEPAASVAGLPLSAWIQQYWQWIRSFPDGKTPTDDTTGEMCAVGQTGPVFFLTGSTQADLVSRTCAVPKGKYVFIPVLKTLAQVPSTSNWTCDELKEFIRKINDSAADLSVTVNGQGISAPSSYKVASGCFDLWDASRSASERAASAGYWVTLNPLDAGMYEIHFSGRYTTDEFRQDIRYRLHVK